MWSNVIGSEMDEMHTIQFNDSIDSERPRRVYWICGLLLLASAVNYMDRQTLSVVAKRITTELHMNETQYGSVESVFGLSFAFGGLLWGVAVDRFSVRWVYPIGLLGWSAVGFLTGFVRNYEELAYCRALLGFFESSHWPCGLKAIQILLTPSSRAMGNSVLQSGTSIGAILTPLIMLVILGQESLGWRFGFQIIAVVGSLWVALWLLVVGRNELTNPSNQRDGPASNQGNGIDSNSIDKPDIKPWWAELFSIRFLLVALMLICINPTWQLLRAWLPKILQEHYHYQESSTLIFNSVWYAVTDIGCFFSGGAALMLCARGWSIKSARVTSFAICAAFCAALTATPFLQSGTLLLLMLMMAGAGALGLFPIYYSFVQDVSERHQGKVSAIASTIGWIASSLAQYEFGRFVDRTKQYDWGLLVIGLFPLISLIAFLLFWPQDSSPPSRIETVP